MDPKIKFIEQEQTKSTSAKNFGSVEEYDMKRLKAYVDGPSEFRVVSNLKCWILITFS